jgi:hypothetical protein
MLQAAINYSAALLSLWAWTKPTNASNQAEFGRLRNIYRHDYRLGL